MSDNETLKNEVPNPDQPVLRKDLVDAINQLGDNMDLIQKNLIDAVNTMYSYHLFPFQMELWALSQLLIEKDVFTEDELNKKIQARKQELLDKAKQIKEGADGKLEPLSEHEATYNEKKAVLRAQNLK